MGLGQGSSGATHPDFSLQRLTAALQSLGGAACDPPGFQERVGGCGRPEGLDQPLQRLLEALYVASHKPAANPAKNPAAAATPTRVSASHHPIDTRVLITTAP